MSVFLRRFTFDPGTEVLLEIEAVNILDLEPVSAVSGVGTGTACVVGEFEDGPFATVTEVASTPDLTNTFGGFGYSYAGVGGNNPCARKRFADAAVVPEFWNGNGLVALNGKRFSRLLVARVDTSVGEVQFSRLAYLLGGKLFSYALTSGDTVVGDRGAGIGAFTATFTGTVAALVSGVGVYPTLFVGGETITIARDSEPAVVVVFQAADQLQSQVISRINAALGYAAAVDSGGGVTTLSGRVGGTGGSIAITAATPAVLAATGFVVGAASGGGNVSNILQVTPQEIDTIVNAASAGAVRVRLLDSGQLRMENVQTPVTGVLRITAGAALTSLGFSVTQAAAYQDAPQELEIVSIDPAVAVATGFAIGSAPVLSSVAGVYPSGFVGGEQMVVQVAGQPPLTIEFDAADQTQAQVLARINLALGYTAAVAQTATRSSLAGPGTLSTVVPAGTLVQTPAGVQWVSMQTLAVTAELLDALTVKVRPANDVGTTVAAVAGAVTVLGRPVQTAAFSTINPLALTAALTEAQLDARYLTALDSTLASATVAAEINLLWAARQSNAIRGALRQNVVDASQGGLLGRSCVIRPPLSTTTRAQAKSNAAQPGVGAYRLDRVWYAFPGVQSFMPAIAQRGLSGGEGFTADGVIDVGADGFLVSVCSQLPPEENPGQLTPYAAGAIGIERGNPDVQTMTINDYKAFRASGIAAPRLDSGVMIFQSGVTSVNPLLQPSLRNIARRRMADFIQDSLGVRLKRFGKQLNTRSRRTQIVGEIRAFMLELQNSQRVAGFAVDLNSGNTPQTLALGIFRILLNVRTWSSLDAIVLATRIGEAVEIEAAA